MQEEGTLKYLHCNILANPGGTRQDKHDTDKQTVSAFGLVLSSFVFKV